MIRSCAAAVLLLWTIGCGGGDAEGISVTGTIKDSTLAIVSGLSVAPESIEGCSDESKAGTIWILFFESEVACDYDRSQSIPSVKLRIPTRTGSYEMTNAGQCVDPGENLAILYAEGPNATYHAEAGSVVVNEVTSTSVRGTFDASMLDTSDQSVISGEFNVVRCPAPQSSE